MSYATVYRGDKNNDPFYVQLYMYNNRPIYLYNNIVTLLAKSQPLTCSSSYTPRPIAALHVNITPILLNNDVMHMYANNSPRHLPVPGIVSTRSQPCCTLSTVPITASGEWLTLPVSGRGRRSMVVRNTQSTSWWSCSTVSSHDRPRHLMGNIYIDYFHTVVSFCSTMARAYISF